MLPDDRLHLGRRDDLAEPRALRLVAILVDDPEQADQWLGVSDGTERFPELSDIVVIFGHEKVDTEERQILAGLELELLATLDEPVTRPAPEMLEDHRCQLGGFGRVREQHFVWFADPMVNFRQLLGGQPSGLVEKVQPNIVGHLDLERFEEVPRLFIELDLVERGKKVGPVIVIGSLGRQFGMIVRVIRNPPPRIDAGPRKQRHSPDFPIVHRLTKRKETLGFQIRIGSPEFAEQAQQMLGMACHRKRVSEAPRRANTQALRQGQVDQIVIVGLEDRAGGSPAEGNALADQEFRNLAAGGIPLEDGAGDERIRFPGTLPRSLPQEADHAVVAVIDRFVDEGAPVAGTFINRTQGGLSTFDPFHQFKKSAGPDVPEQLCLLVLRARDRVNRGDHVKNLAPSNGR